MACLYRAYVGVSHTIGKLLTSAGDWALYYPASYLSKARESTVASIKRYTVIIESKIMGGGGDITIIERKINQVDPTIPIWSTGALGVLESIA